EHDVALADLDALVLRGRGELGAADPEAAPAGVAPEQRGHVEQHPARDDRCQLPRVGLERTEVAEELVGGPAAVPRVPWAARDVAKGVDVRPRMCRPDHELGDEGVVLRVRLRNEARVIALHRKAMRRPVGHEVEWRVDRMHWHAVPPARFEADDPSLARDKQCGQNSIGERSVQSHISSLIASRRRSVTPSVGRYGIVNASCHVGPPASLTQYLGAHAVPCHVTIFDGCRHRSQRGCRKVPAIYVSPCSPRERRAMPAPCSTQRPPTFGSSTTSTRPWPCTFLYGFRLETTKEHRPSYARCCAHSERALGTIQNTPSSHRNQTTVM